MITTDNYTDKIKAVNISLLPEALRKGHEYVKKITDNGAHWNNYSASPTIKNTVDIYFEKLNKVLNEQSGGAKKKGGSPKKVSPKKPHESKAGNATTVSTDRQPMLVERLPEEVKFIKRFLNLEGKPKSKDDILRFVNSLQKAILEKKIRKSSQYADKIRFIQDKLIEGYNEMGTTITFRLKPETLDALTIAANDEKVLPSVGFIKRYINLNGKSGIKDKAKLLLGQINRAYESGKISDGDPYIVEMHEVRKNLELFIGEKSKVLRIEKNTLNGLEGIINGCACHNLNGLDDEVIYGKPVVMNSMDFAKLQFNTLGFKDKWLNLIGDPSSNFTMMVYGKPKMGKSYLCIDFAGYLARNHGKVLYVAKEEGLDKTLQDKLNDTDVKHPNLDVAATLPASLAPYNFIFLDSVSKLGLTPDDLNKLKAQYPDKSFVYVFQTTKDGKFRGENTFQHDVDSVIEIPEKGQAIQYGRFNAGGEMSIF
jgi:predicted HicB family RNase H-like nuclease